MKVLRYILFLTCLVSILMLQACGSGGSTDTAGNVTIDSTSSVDNKDGTATVSVKATYTPPAGKSAQGVVLNFTAIDNASGASTSGSYTLNSISNSVTFTFLVSNTAIRSLSISASVNGMSSSTVFVVPAATATTTALTVSSTTLNFLATDGAGVDNSASPITISGGTAPYAVSSNSADITASNSTINSQIIITKNTAAGVNPVTATVTVTDSAATPATKTITVNYFK